MLNPIRTVSIAAASAATGFPENTLRHWIYGEGWNGSEEWIIRVGRRIYVDLDAFTRWLEAHRGSGKRRGLLRPEGANRKSARTDAS